jgi:hypothetical protein
MLKRERMGVWEWVCIIRVLINVRLAHELRMKLIRESRGMKVLVLVEVLGRDIVRRRSKRATTKRWMECLRRGATGNVTVATIETTYWGRRWSENMRVAVRARLRGCGSGVCAVRWECADRGSYAFVSPRVIVIVDEVIVEVVMFVFIRSGCRDTSLGIARRWGAGASALRVVAEQEVLFVSN